MVRHARGWQAPVVRCVAQEYIIEFFFRPALTCRALTLIGKSVASAIFPVGWGGGLEAALHVKVAGTSPERNTSWQRCEAS